MNLKTIFHSFLSLICVFGIQGLSSAVSAQDNLHRYPLLNGNTYSDNSGFVSTTPIYWLWDGSTVEGVNDTKATGEVEAWVEFDFGREETIAEAGLWQDHGGSRVTSWKLMYWKDEAWTDAFDYVACSQAGWQTQTFDVCAPKVRFYAKCASGGNVSIHELALYSKPSPTKGRIKIACVGDSNTAGSGASNKGFYAWPVQLGDLFGNDYFVRNFGESGATLMSAPADKPWRGTYHYALHQAFQPDIVIISLGTNDSKSQNWIASSPTRFQDDYISLVQEFQAYTSSPEVYLMLPIKAFPSNFTIDDATIREKILPIIRSLSLEYGLPLIDGYTTTEGFLNLMVDGIHPNDAGLKIIAEKVAEILETPKPILEINGKPSVTKYAAYRWYKDGVLITDASGASYKTSEPGRYKVAVKLNNTTDDTIVSEEIAVTASAARLVVTDGSATALQRPEPSEVAVTCTYGTLQIEWAAGAFLHLFDLKGCLVKAIEIADSSETVSIADLSPGVYLYKLGSATGKIVK